MLSAMKAILLNGSPRPHSRTSALLEHLAGLLQEKGYEAEVVDLLALGLPYNDPLYHDKPWEHPDQKVRDFAQKIKEAEVVVLGTPLYHGSFSGLLKSALDHLIDEAFAGKAVGVVSQAAGLRVATQGAQQLAIVARTMYGRVSHRLIGTAKADYTEQGEGFVLSSDEMLQRSEIFVHDLLEQLPNKSL